MSSLKLSANLMLSQSTGHTQNKTYLKYLALALIGLGFLCVMLKVELPMLLGFNPEWEHRVKSYISILHIHAFTGTLALLIGGIQFLTLPAIWHRILGRFYVSAICISAPLAIWIAIEHLSNTEALAVTIQALLWMCSTFAAAYYAIERQFKQHRIWILRSYALSCTFVVSRLLLDVMHLPLSKQFGDGAAFLWELSLLALLVAQYLAPADNSTT